MKKFAVFSLTFVLMGMLLGCGGGGGGGGGGTTGPTENNVTISGKIQADEINDSLLASIRFAAGSNIDYSKLSVSISGLTDKFAVSASGSYSVQLPESKIPKTVILNVLSSKSLVLMKKQVEYQTGTLDYSNQNVSATTTALAFLVENDSTSTLTESKILAQNDASLYQAMLDKVGIWLKTSSATISINQDTNLTSLAQQTVTNFQDVKTKEDQINTNYLAIKAIFENNQTTPDARVASLMTFIHPDFENSAGVKSFADLQSTTLSRFQRYTINKFVFTVGKFTHNASDTITVETPIEYDVKKNPGMPGGIEAASGNISPAPQIVWKLYNSKWLILKGLPYLTDDFGF
ncbi:MAG: hypothetical protein HQM08_00850 [Candidatus Riflebacteria bacterium]|nr:hypothetical protein [Candidatus Riflebacteria bacterium]